MEVIVSDLHLGSPTCQDDKINYFLKHLPEHTTRLILNGDVLEGINCPLQKAHWKILHRLRKLSQKMEIIWIKGNHDDKAFEVAHLVAANFCNELSFVSGGRTILCRHGHMYDNFLENHPIITLVSDWIYMGIQKISRELAVAIKKKSKIFIRCTEQIKIGAIKEAIQRKADVVICGHTHFAEHVKSPIEYVNSGCWTNHHCHYVQVENGEVSLVEAKV